MKLLAPWLLACAALLLPLIAAFLNRRRIVRRTVPSLVLLRHLQGEARSRRHFAMPQHWVALALCALALLGAAFAAAQPTWEGHEPHTTVVVVDTSASMGAVEPGQRETRLVRALERLEPFLAALPEHDPVAVVSAGANPRVLLRPTADRDLLRGALARLQPEGAWGAAGLELAQALCASRAPSASILLVTDGAGAAVPAGGACPVARIRVGDDAVNAAITRLSVRDADALGLAEVYVEALNTGDAPRRLHIDLSVDDVLAEVVALDAPAGGSAGRLIQLRVDEGQRIAARLQSDQPDALAADDEAFVARATGGRLRALLVSSHPGSFVAEALRLHPRVDLQVVTPGGVDPNGVFDLVVAEDAVPVAALPKAARVVAFGPATQQLGLAAAAEPVTRPRIVWWAFDDPLFRYVNLDSVEIEATWTLAAGAGVRPLVLGEDELILAALATLDGRQVLALGVDTDRTDLVFRVAFTNLVANFVEWAMPAASAAAPLQLQPGQSVPDAPAGATLVDGSGAAQPATAPLLRPGFYTLRDADGRDLRTVAVSLLHPGESWLRPVVDLPNTTPAVAAAPSWLSSLWKVPLLLAVLFLLVEWALPLLRRRRASRAPAPLVVPTPQRSNANRNPLKT